jgi:hypothetical protein
MAAEQRPVLGNISGRWAAVLVVFFLVIAYGVWFYYGPHAADQSGRAQTMSGLNSAAPDDTAGIASRGNKENTATPMIGQATGNDGSPRPMTPKK